MRKNNPPQDIWEMTIIDEIKCVDVTNVLDNGCKINFDGMERTHLQPYVFAGFLQYANQKSFENFVSSSKLSNDNEMETKNENIQKIIQR